MGYKNGTARLVQSIGAYRFLARYVCVRFSEQPDIARIRRTDALSATGDILFERCRVQPLDTGRRPVRRAKDG